MKPSVFFRFFSHQTSGAKLILSSFFAGLLLSGGAKADVVAEWNSVMCNIIQAEGNSAGHANPGWSTRAIAMTNGAIYDAFQAVNRTHTPFHADFSSAPDTSKQAAAAQAAHDVLLAAYPSQAATLSAALSTSLAAIPAGPGKNAGLALGSQVANSYLTWRQNDGADVSVPYTQNPEPGHWRPDPLHPGQQAWGPAYGSVTPFAITSTTQFNTPPPPALTSQRYADSLNQVQSLGALNSTTRTADQTEIALFWAYDRAVMGPPPVLYTANLLEISQQMGTSEDGKALLFAKASVSMADAAIAAWDVKFDGDLWRPVNAIREAGTDGNPLTTADPLWQPLGAPGADPSSTADDFTPPFPAYVSGHATMGEAVYSTLRDFYGTDQASFVLTSKELLGVERNYSSFSQASNENALSRVYLGVHFDFDSLEGQTLGAGIAGYVAANYFSLLPVPEPSSGLCLLLVFAAGLRRRRRNTA
jgi:PAP2 superfamily